MTLIACLITSMATILYVTVAVISKPVEHCILGLLADLCILSRSRHCCNLLPMLSKEAVLEAFTPFNEAGLEVFFVLNLTVLKNCSIGRSNAPQKAARCNCASFRSSHAKSCTVQHGGVIPHSSPYLNPTIDNRYRQGVQLCSAKAAKTMMLAQATVSTTLMNPRIWQHNSLRRSRMILSKQ